MIFKTIKHIIQTLQNRIQQAAKLSAAHCLLQSAICLLFLTFNFIVATAQSFPVQVIPQVTPPPTIYFSEYANENTVNSPLRVQLILNDFEIVNREVRLRVSFEGSGISFQSKDIVTGASPLFLEGGVPLVLTNVELAPYFRYENLNGISGNVYGNAIPEGAYNFCFEVFDVLTGNRLSRKSCAISVVFQNEPPFLVSPRNKTNVEEINPQNIVFQWTPRHVNVSNVEYELSIVEIWDTQVDPQQAFLSSPPVFQTVTNATTYVYGPADPLFLSGKNYAWRVQAKAKQGLEEVGLFENQGYSEIYSFSYAGSCDLPLGINHEVKGSTNANIFWDDFSTDVPEYTLRYRQRNVEGAEWFPAKTTLNEITIWNLKPGTTYEYQISKKCSIIQSDWSPLKEFTTTLEFEEESVLDCGISPKIEVTNREPLSSLSTGMTFKAGDFPVEVLQVSGSNGRFTGKGYVKLPYLKNIKVYVEFTNILVNTDHEMAEGSVRTSYDPTWSNILDTADLVDQLDDLGDVFSGGDNIDYEVDFIIASTDNIEIENDKIVVSGANGESKFLDYDEGDTYQIRDSNGNTFNIDKKGSITKGSEAAQGGEATSQNTDGISGGNGTAESPSVSEITANAITIEFKKTENTKYALDIVDNDFERARYPKATLTNGESYYPPHKAVVAGRSDVFAAEVTISNADIKIDSIIFKTVKGSKIDFYRSEGNTFLITVKGANSYRSEEIIATYKDKDGLYKIAASFFLHHIKEQEEVNVVVVSVNGTTGIPDLQAQLNNIYGQAGANFNVTTENWNLESKNWDDNNNQKLDYNASGLLSDYPQELKNIQQQYKKDNPNWSSKAYHLFLLPSNITLTKPLNGFMPKTRQWGYIFSENDNDQTLENKDSQFLSVAHELGHGVFKLAHPFQDDTNYSGSNTNWLMDYGGGNQLSYSDWTTMSDESLRLHLFQDEEEGEIARRIWFTPDWTPFSIENSSIIRSKDESDRVKGTVPGFRLNNGIAYDAVYDNAGRFKGYFVDGDDKSNRAYELELISDINNGSSVYLYESVPNECANTYLTNYGYVDSNKNKIDFSSANSNLSSVDITTNCDKDLCAEGRKFYDSYAPEIKNKSLLEDDSLKAIAQLICAEGDNAIDYDILVAQIGKDEGGKRNSFWNGHDKNLFDIARELFWQREDAFQLYLYALQTVNQNITSYNNQLNSNATKEDYYAALYYLNENFLKELSFEKKKELIKLIFKHNFFISDDFLQTGKSDVSLLKKIVNTIDETDINLYLSDLVGDESKEFTQSNREVLLEICNAIELDLLRKAEISVKVEALKRLLKGNLFNVTGRNYHDVITKVIQSVSDSQARTFLTMLEDKQYGYDKKPLVYYLKENISNLFSNGNAYTEFFKQLIKLTAAKAQLNPDTYKIVAEIDWKVENRDYVLISVVRDKSKYKYSYDEINHKVRLTTCKETVSLPDGSLYCKKVENIMPSDASLFDFVMVYFYKDASPFSPIATKNIYSDESEIEAQGYAIPALFLEYMQNQTDEARLKNFAWNTFNVVITVATIGEGTAAIQVVRVAANSGKKVLGKAILRQGFALMDFTYTVGTNGYRLKTGNQLPEYVQNIGYLFAAKGVYDLTESGLKGLKGLRALKQLSDDDKMRAINDYLKITRKDGKSITIEEVNEFMTTAEQKILSSENIQWKEAWISTESYSLSTGLLDGLDGNSRKIFDELIDSGLSYVDDGKSIKFIDSEGFEIGSIVNNNFQPRKWFKTYKNTVVKKTESGYWLIRSGDEYGFHLGFKDGREFSSEYVNMFHKGIGNHEPYKQGTKIFERHLSKGDKVYVVEYKNGGNPSPGGWGSKNKITTLKEVREDLAILNEWKNLNVDDLVLREYTVIQPLPVRDGVVGPMKETSGTNSGQIYYGNQHQYEFIEYLGSNTWEKYFDVENIKTYQLK